MLSLLTIISMACESCESPVSYISSRWPSHLLKDIVFMHVFCQSSRASSGLQLCTGMLECDRNAVKSSSVVEGSRRRMKTCHVLPLEDADVAPVGLPFADAARTFKQYNKLFTCQALCDCHVIINEYYCCYYYFFCPPAQSRGREN